MKRSAWLMGTLILLGGCAQEELPGEKFSGTLTAPTSIETPLSGSPACVVGVELYSRSQPGQKGTSTYARSPVRWAPGAALKVGGEQLHVQGADPSVTLSESGGTWKWTKGQPTKVPAWVLGWGHDATLNALTDSRVTHYYTHLEATEKPHLFE